MSNSYWLSKAPDGLLGTLDLKNTGKNPQAVGDTLEPSIDVLPFYLLRNRLCLAGAGPWVALGATIVLTSAAFAQYFNAAGALVVPAAEVFRIKSLSLTCVRNAADAGLTLELAVFIKRTLTAGTVAIGSGTFGPKPATDLSGVQQVALTEPLWLGPGDALSVVPLTTQTAAGSTIRLNLDMDSVPSG